MRARRAQSRAGDGGRIDQAGAEQVDRSQKLNHRTGSPTTDPEVVIPYGAFVENVEADRDFERFTYLGELYQCPHTLLASATDPRAWKAQRAPAATGLRGEPLDSSHAPLLRAKVKGGWLIAAGSGAGVTFYPDPGHEWDGTSLERGSKRRISEKIRAFVDRLPA